jgi:hypothetical protein
VRREALLYYDVVRIACQATLAGPLGVYVPRPVPEQIAALGAVRPRWRPQPPVIRVAPRMRLADVDVTRMLRTVELAVSEALSRTSQPAPAARIRASQPWTQPAARRAPCA